MHLAGLPVHHLELRARVVGERLLARPSRGDLGEDGRRRRYNRFSSAPTRSLQGDRHGPESVIDMLWNH